ncbi:hypothetical protein BAE44_0022871 [Dichanthelium oligosanthes]|uniref:Uncharacterized protein n=1 Tax=Dichanthelium oligosanthes TaxID=888268 RepID=A0A1E5UTB8_9POAL|nr:hypothetical protein BAE44_0022871 [Dichanthelium oligosanthes]
MSARWLKLLLLVTLIPLALRATSLLLGGYAVPATTSHHRQSPIRSRSSGDATATATGRGSVSAGVSVHGRPYRQTRHRRRSESTRAAFNGTRWLRQANADGYGWFEDDKGGVATRMKHRL